MSWLERYGKKDLAFLRGAKEIFKIAALEYQKVVTDIDARIKELEQNESS